MEQLMTIFLFATSVIGMTHIIVDSSIFMPVREYLKKVLPPRVYSAIECYQCCGTWCGLFLGFILVSYNPIKVLICGFSGSFLAAWAAFYLNYLEARTIVNFKSESENG